VTDEVPDWAQDRLRLFPAALTPSAYDRIVARGEACAFERGALHNSATGERFVDPHYRLTSVGWLKGRDWIYDLAHAYAARANLDWGFDIDGADELQYALYRKHDFFEWHKDLLRVRGGPIRKLSVVIQLSAPDAYCGGRLEFLDDDFGRYTPEAFLPQGSVAVFTSLLKHRVTPITMGERRSLTAWFKGPPFR